MLNKSELNPTKTGWQNWAGNAAQNTRSGDSKHQSSQNGPKNPASRKVDPNGAGDHGGGGKKTVGNQHAATTQPTVSEFFAASVAEYTQGQTAGHLTPLEDNGKQVIGENIGDGMYGSVWTTPQGQLVISFEGTSGATPEGQNQDLLKAQQTEDTKISNGEVTDGERDALAFTQQVMATAAQHGISSDNIFVTGHSLGGIQAEYVAQQTGLGGMAFEATGLPPSATAVGDGKNFVDVVTHGDPVAFDASDVQGEQPVAPPFVPGGGSLSHYGQVLEIGDSSQDAALTSDAQHEVPKINAGQLTAPQAVGDLLSSRSQYHVLATQAYNLGITVPPSLQGGVRNGVETGPVDDVADETLSQLLQQSFG